MTKEIATIAPPTEEPLSAVEEEFVPVDETMPPDEPQKAETPAPVAVVNEVKPEPLAPMPKPPVPTSKENIVLENKSPPKKEDKKPTPVKKAEPKKAEPKKNEPKKPAPIKPAPPKPSKMEAPTKPAKKAEAPVKNNKATPVVQKTEVQADKIAADKSAAEKKAAAQRVAEQQRKKETEQKAAQARRQELLAQAQERIAKIGVSRDKLSPGKSPAMPVSAPPSAITTLHIDGLAGANAPVLSDREVRYRDELAGRLKLLLRLPEYGEVKIKLTLERSGKVAKVVVVSAESAINRKHIEKTLPSLTFPAFGINFTNAEQYTFVVTLSNEL